MDEGAPIWIDARDGRLWLQLPSGTPVFCTSVPHLALVAHTFSIPYLTDPPPDEDWPDYVTVDSRFLMQANEELRQLREVSHQLTHSTLTSA